MARLLLGGLLVMLASAPALACFVPPSEVVTPYQELVARTATIVLARAVGEETRPDDVIRYRFRRLQVLKGTVPPLFSMDVAQTWETDRRRAERGLGGANRAGVPDDFDRHRAPEFWDGSGRTGNGGDCVVRPDFVPGSRYLLFLDEPYHWKSFEQIDHDDDRWLAAVRTEIRTAGMVAGFSQTVLDWLRERGPVDLIEYNCPATSEVADMLKPIVRLMGPAVPPGPVDLYDWRRRWEDACEVGGRFLRVQYSGGESWLLVREGRADFSNVRTGVHFTGDTRLSLEEIRRLR